MFDTVCHACPWLACRSACLIIIVYLITLFPFKVKMEGGGNGGGGGGGGREDTSRRGKPGGREVNREGGGKSKIASRQANQRLR